MVKNPAEKEHKADSCVPPSTSVSRLAQPSQYPVVSEGSDLQGTPDVLVYDRVAVW